MVVDQRYSAYLDNNPALSAGGISLTSYDPKFMEYSYDGGGSFVVFSEIFYQGSGNDWQAYIDGEAVEHIRVNYLLRGMKVPSGKHDIVFKFAPKSYYTGRNVNMAGSAILIVLMIYLGWSTYREQSQRLEA